MSDSDLESDTMLGQLIKSVSQTEGKKTAVDPNETSESAGSEQEVVFVFDEVKLRELVDEKRESLGNSREFESMKVEISRLRDELDANQHKLVKAEAKIKVKKS